MNQTTRRMSALLLTLFLTLAFALPANAQQAGSATPDASQGSSSAENDPPAKNAGPAFVIHPIGGVDGDYFTLEAEAGTTTELVAVLGNADDKPMDLSTYANDAVPATNGGFAIADEEIPATGTATWLTYPAETFTFDPGKGIERRFSITIPEGTAPGQYIAGLALQTAHPIAVEGSSLFNQIIRKVVAVFIIVPGPETPAFSLGTPVLMGEGRVPQIAIPVTNSGNVLVKPHGTLALTDTTGTTVLEAPIAMGSVYAGTTVPLSLGLNTEIPDGDYELTVHLTDEATGTTASIENGVISIVAAENTTSDFNLEGTVTLLPHAAAPVYADVSATVVNNGQEEVNSRILLDVSKDGNLVETFPLVPALTLPQGETAVTQRYIPPTGWESGSWSFVLRLDIVDTVTGTSTNVATLDIVPPVVIGG